MSLYAYCQKTSDGEQNYHCSNKCLACVIEIARVKTIWNERFNKQKQK